MYWLNPGQANLPAAAGGVQNAIQEDSAPGRQNGCCAFLCIMIEASCLPPAWVELKLSLCSESTHHTTGEVQWNWQRHGLGPARFACRLVSKTLMTSSLT